MVSDEVKKALESVSDYNKRFPGFQKTPETVYKSVPEGETETGQLKRANEHLSFIESRIDDMTAKLEEYKNYAEREIKKERIRAEKSEKIIIVVTIIAAFIGAIAGFALNRLIP